MREKELAFQVEEVAEKNTELILKTQDSDTLRQQNLQLAKELQLSKDAKYALQAELTKTKESMLKGETKKELASAKETQMQKDCDLYERQIATQAKELQKLRDELSGEVKRREELVESHFEEIKQIQNERE